MLKVSNKLIGVIILILLFNACVGHKKRKRKKRKKEQAEQIQQINNVELARALLRPQSYKGKIERDPFRPLNFKPVQGTKEIDIDITSQVKLLGVTLMGDKKVALIQTPVKQGLYYLGDDISGYKIKDIDFREIILEKDGKEFIVKMRGEK